MLIREVAETTEDGTTSLLPPNEIKTVSDGSIDAVMEEAADDGGGGGDGEDDDDADWEDIDTDDEDEAEGDNTEDNKLQPSKTRILYKFFLDKAYTPRGIGDL